MLQTSQTGTNSKPYLGCSPHLKVIEAPPQKDLKLVLCYVGIYMQKVGKHLGVSIPSPSCLHSIDNHFPLAKSQRNFIHSHKSGHSPWELKRSPDFLLTCRWDWCDMSSRLHQHTNPRKLRTWNHAKNMPKSIKTSLTWNLLLIFLAFERGHLGSIVRISWSIASFVWGTRDPKRPLMQRLAIQVQRSENGCYKCIILRSLRSFKRHYRTNTQHTLSTSNLKFHVALKKVTRQYLSDTNIFQVSR